MLVKLGVKMRQTLFILLLMSFVFSITVGRGEFTGYLDNRYVWSQKVSAGTGTFQINNLFLSYDFPLNKKYKVYLQTNLSPGTSSQIVNQLYLDTLTSLPLQMKIGRFAVNTMERDNGQEKSSFISRPIFWDTNWQVANNPILPDCETGIMLYNTGKNHDLNFFIVNGSNAWQESTLESKKAVGAYARTMFKNLFELRGSAYSNFYDNGQYDFTTLTGEAMMNFYDIKLKGGVLVLAGKNNGITDNGVGGIFEITLPFESNTDLSAFASIFKNGQYFYRGAIALKTILNQDMIWKNEFCMEKDSTNYLKDIKVQSQLIVLL